ncbi:MAG TPA: hypothetical protein VM077_04860 [Candidatus Limnocylindrales bacterium]|nr:hypothetical protein [Candidatus Limnocylindrales bacterium]
MPTEGEATHAQPEPDAPPPDAATLTPSPPDITDVPPPDEPLATPEPITSPEGLKTRRNTELGQIVSNLFRGRLVGENGKRRPAAEINADPVSRKINYSNELGEISADALLSDPKEFPEEPSAKDGEPVFVTLASGERAKLIKITAVDGEDDLTCEYEVDIVTGAEKTSKRTKGPVSRKSIVQGNIVAERTAIEAGFTGDEQAVVRAYIDSLDPAIADPELPTDEQIEGVAKDRMLTTEDVRNLITKISPDVTKLSPETQKLLKGLEGKLVLTPSDFREVINLMGGSKEAFSKRSEELTAEIIRLKGIVTANPDDKISRIKLEEIQAEQALIGNAYDLLTETNDKGQTQLDQYFEMAQNGELNSNEAQAFIQAIREGDFTSLIDQIVTKQTENIPPDQKEAEKTLLRKALTVGAYTVGSPLGIAALLAAIMAGLVVAGTQSLAGAGGRR